MKKLMIIGLAVLMVFMFTACSDSGKVSEPTPTQGIVEDILDMATQTPEATEVPVVTATPDILDATAAPTEEPAAE